MTAPAALPDDFERRLRTASVDELKAVFETLPVDARDAATGCTAIGFAECPDELITWLAGRGLDMNATDQNGATALWMRVLWGEPEQIPLLVSLGADVELANESDIRPLEGAVMGFDADTVRVLLANGARVDIGAGTEDGTVLQLALDSADHEVIPQMLDIAVQLLDAGDEVTTAMQGEVTRLGKEFERVREHYEPEYLDETVASLTHLYAVFGVEPVPPHVTHDGVSPIVVPRGTRQEQYDALWDLLVPAAGIAASTQGEVIRIVAEVETALMGDDDEEDGWGRDHKKMLAALPKYFESGIALSRTDLADLKVLAKRLRPDQAADEDLERLRELAVTWVDQNITPIPVGKVRYRG
ncbi:ankyrin repeat domain-containing protein [Microbacterium sp. NPDC077644]|uniref:ankyrin repeat domain-containing protein n=1 Tax=Microbacterium sp. NPDC077644 TaxID=3155055 RepID=UPI0034501AEC